MNMTKLLGKIKKKRKKKLYILYIHLEIKNY